MTSGRVAHPDFLELAAEKRMEVNGGETGFLLKVFVLDELRQLVIVLVVCMGLKDLITELLHDVQVLRVNHLGLNDLQAINASQFNSFLIEHVDVVVCNNDEAVFLNILLDHLLTHKRQQHYVLLFKNVCDLIICRTIAEQINGESVKEGVVTLPRLSHLSPNYG